MSQGLIRDRRETDRLMQIVLDNVPMVVSIKNLDGHYLFVNRRYEQLHQVDRNSVIGKCDHDLFPVAQADALCANDQKTIESGRACVFDEAADWGGAAHTYNTLKFPLFDSRNVPYAVCCISTDVTENRRAEHELLILRRQAWHSDRIAHIGSITASIAHELNQPLAAILSNAQAALRFLDRGSVDLQELHAILEDIVRDDKRAAAVISGLRAMMRRQETPREKLDLREAITEVLELMHGEFVQRGVDCDCDLDSCCSVHADKTQIQQIMINLVLNALEAMAEQPTGQRRLRVSVAPDDAGRGACVAVCDSGTGIAAAELDRVFDAFYTTKPAGLGMGLAVCRSIIEAHGGSLWAEHNKDCGVTFFFTLPLCEQRDTPTTMDDHTQQEAVGAA